MDRTRTEAERKCRKAWQEHQKERGFGRENAPAETDVSGLLAEVSVSVRGEDMTGTELMDRMAAMHTELDALEARADALGEAIANASGDSPEADALLGEIERAATYLRERT